MSKRGWERFFKGRIEGLKGQLKLERGRSLTAEGWRRLGFKEDLGLTKVYEFDWHFKQRYIYCRICEVFILIDDWKYHLKSKKHVGIPISPKGLWLLFEEWFANRKYFPKVELKRAGENFIVVQKS